MPTGGSGVDLARLQIIFDTTSAPGAIAAMQNVAAQSKSVGAAVDQAAQKINQHNTAMRSGAKSLSDYGRAAGDLKRALDEEARAAAMVANGWDKRHAAINRVFAREQAMYQRGAIGAREYTHRLQFLQAQMDKMALSGKSAADSLALMSGAFGGFFGAFAYQGFAGFTQFITQIAGLPGDLAHAGDELTRLNARLTFAFRGSSEAASRARADIIAIARASGVPYSQVAQSYGDIAIAGRGPGLSRAQIGGLTGAFSMLGQMTGSDNASTGRAMWQFQQALALGRLTYQDFRFMSTNMPAIDDAMAAGLGVDVNRIPQMISRGEISAERMVDGLIKGVEILKQSAGGLPETMERARGRIQTEWELLLSNMEERIQSSDLWRAIMGGVSGALGDVNTALNGSPEEMLEMRRRHLESLPRGGGYDSYRRLIEQDIAALEARIADPTFQSQRALEAEAEAARERGVDRRAALNRGFGAMMDLDPMQSQGADLRDLIARLQGAIDASGALGGTDVASMTARDAELARQQQARLGRGESEDSREYQALVTSRRALQEQISGAAALGGDQLRDMQRALAGAHAQLNNVMYAYQRLQVQARQANSDLARFGAGGGFAIAQSARGLIQQALAQNVVLDRDTARGIVLDQRFIGIGDDLGQADAATLRRQGVVDAAGGNVTQRRQAEIRAAADEYFARNFGQRGDLSPEQLARADEATQRFARNRAAGYAQDDVQALRERERADRERLETLRQQFEFGARLGQQGRIALAQAERERELRRAFPEITQELVEAERARVAELVRASEQLDLQQRQFELLVDAARTAGGAISQAFRASIVEGVRTGSLDAAAAFDVLEDRALRVLDRLMERAFAPFDRIMNEAVDGLFNRLPGFGGQGQGQDGGLGQLQKAAENTASELASSLTPELAASALNMATSTSAVQAEAATRIAAIKSLSVMTAAAEAAAAALNAVAAGGGGEGTASLVASIFGGKSAFGHAFGAYGISRFAAGGVVARPTYFAYGGGLGLMGEADPEAVLPLKRDKNGRLGVASEGGEGPNVVIQVIDQRTGGGQVEQETTRGPNGERQVRLFIRDAVKGEVRNGALDSDMRSRYGASPSIIQR